MKRIRRAASRVLVSVVVAGFWLWPVDGAPAIAREYIAPATPYSAGHRGIDVWAPVGTEVRAPADGVVHFAGFVVDRPLVSLEHAGGVLSSFEPVEPTVAVGDAVHRGDVIGTVVAGHCSSPCLHVGVRVGGEYVNPMLFFGGAGWSVLLPRDTAP